MLSIHAEHRVRLIQSLGFPAVFAEWGTKHGPHDVIKAAEPQSPPCPTHVVAVKVSIADMTKRGDFEIAAFRLRRLDYGLGQAAFFETYGNPPRAWERRWWTLEIPADRAASGN